VCPVSLMAVLSLMNIHESSKDSYTTRLRFSRRMSPGTLRASQSVRFAIREYHFILLKVFT
jgi:hypothetical protein